MEGDALSRKNGSLHVFVSSIEFWDLGVISCMPVTGQIATDVSKYDTEKPKM